jgi:hypothetical protein
MEHDLERRSRQNAAMNRGGIGTGGGGSASSQSPTKFFTNYQVPPTNPADEESSPEDEDGEGAGRNSILLSSISEMTYQA